MTEKRPRVLFSTIDLFLVIIAAVALVFWREAGNLAIPFDAYPKLVCTSLFALAFACLVQQRLKSTNCQTGDSRLTSQFRTWAMIAGIGLYIVCISNIGYFVSSFIYLVAMLQIGRYGIDKEFLETKTLFSDSLIAAIVTTAIALVFKVSLNLVFPNAWLF